MNGINDLHCLNVSEATMGPEALGGVALASLGATIFRNNAPHASRQIGAPWGVIFFRPSAAAERTPELAVSERDEGAA